MQILICNEDKYFKNYLLYGCGLYIKFMYN